MATSAPATPATPATPAPLSAPPAAPAIDDPFGLLGGLDLSACAWGGLGAGWSPGAAGPLWIPALAPPDTDAPAGAPAPPPEAKVPMVLRAEGRKKGAADARAVAGGAPGAAEAAEAAQAQARAATKAIALAAAALVQEPDACPQCGGGMRRGANNLSLQCDDCGLVVEGDTADPEEDDAPRAAPNTGRLRLVGPGSNLLQPDLYRSGSGNTAAAQKKQILEEYKGYRQLYIEAGGRAFPFNALENAADYYNDVQKICVKRSQNKATIMATCLKHGCLQIGFAPTRAELAAFMQLKNKGIARGGNFVHSLVADGKMSLEINADPSRAEIMTLFAHLGFESGRYAGLQDAVFRVVHTAIDNNIGTSSILRSKVAGATYAVLRRCKDRELIPKPLSMQEFCGKRIRKNTVERFTRELDDYHSYFEPVYQKAGLDSAPARRAQ